MVSPVLLAKASTTLAEGELGPKPANRGSDVEAAADPLQGPRALQARQRLIDCRPGAEMQQFLGADGGAFRLSGQMGQDLCGERLHGLSC